MTTNNILKASLNDIIFDGRNKEYGAYELRNSYDSRIGKALLTTGILIGLAIGASAIAGSGKKHETVYRVGPGMNLTEIVEKKQDKIPPPEKKIQAQQPEVKTVKLTEFKIVDKDKLESPPPSVSDIEKANIGSETRDGIDYTGEVSKPGPETVSGSTGIVETKPEPQGETIFTEVAIPARFTGNWRSFLERNLNANIPVDNGAEPGRYTVMIQFVVDSEGNISDIKPLSNIGYGMEEEAIRVLRKAKGWEPAIQNGLKVKAYHKQPITFEVLGES